MSNSHPKIFYDIHCHTMNLSHPCLYAFIRRHPLYILLGPFILLARKSKNLLSIMERSIEEILYTMDLKNDPFIEELKIPNGQSFDSMVITPLLMDFWSKESPGERLDYPFTSKSIVPQVLDVFNGIADFAHTLRGKTLTECKKQFPTIVDTFATQVGLNAEERLDLWKIRKSKSVAEEEKKKIEQAFGPQTQKMKVFPFMGLNPSYCYLKGNGRKPHESTELTGLLDKYFGSNSGKEPYQGKHSDFERTFGGFSGDIAQLGRNCFAGIKVYPPLGFDPWPENSHENDKVRYLYKFCATHSIPITAHCSYGGYRIVSRKKMMEYTHPRKWKQVLCLKECSQLKLNLAHFGGAGAGFQYAAQDNYLKQLYYKIVKGGEPEWVEEICGLIDRHENVYTDMGFSGVDEDYYRVLAQILKRHPRVEERLLFGTDFSINLTHIKSYKEYILKFLNTEHLREEQKLKLCSMNPERFLFK